MGPSQQGYQTSPIGTLLFAQVPEAPLSYEQSDVGGPPLLLELRSHGAERRGQESNRVPSGAEFRGLSYDLCRGDEMSRRMFDVPASLPELAPVCWLRIESGHPE
jgi:hypothetical protein